MTEPEIKALFESMVIGSATTEVEVFRTLRISGKRDAVLRTLGQSHKEEADGDQLLGEVEEYKVPYETHRMFGVPKPLQQA